MDARRGLRRVATLAAHVTPQSSGVVVAPEVAEALAAGKAVVALESTIVSHGMPYPQNLTMAREVEAVVRAHGAVPATVAVIDGVPRVGLSGRAGACNTTQKQARPPRLSLCLTMTVQTIFLDEF